MAHETLLTSTGLSPKEARVYETLLSEGAANVPTLVSRLGEKRGVIHFLLQSLSEKGLVRKQKNKKEVSFSPEHPSKLQELINQREKSLDTDKENLLTALPFLVSEYNLSSDKPGVYYFEGIDGLKKVYEDTLKEEKPIDAVLQTENVEPKLLKWLTSQYVRRRIKLKIPVRAVVASDKKDPLYTKKDKEELRQSKIVSKSKFPFALELSIYGDKLAFMGHNKEAGLTAVIIENPKIAQTMRAWFDLTWENIT